VDRTGLILRGSLCRLRSYRSSSSRRFPGDRAASGRNGQKLTLEQKIRLLAGVDSVFARSEPAVGFSGLKMSDGPIGARFWGPTTAYTAGIAMAATWDSELAHRVGSAIGDDARSRGVHVLLGPGVNIYRAPMCGTTAKIHIYPVAWWSASSAACRSAA
jgi:hypothetical protein